MRWSTLGHSAVEITELSFGAAAISNLFTPVEPEAAASAVDAAWEVGIRTFDTAPHYGLGLSERRLGEALRTRPRDAYTLSTKVGRLLEPCPADGDDLDHGFAVAADHRRVWDFSADGVRRSIEESLERLGLDRIDIVYLHDPDEHEEAAFRHGYPALERLRAEGVIGAIGAGMNQAPMLSRFLRDTDVDAVLCSRPLHAPQPERARRTAARGSGPGQERRRRRGLQLRTARRSTPRRHLRLHRRTRRDPRPCPEAQGRRRTSRRPAASRRPALPLLPPGRRGCPGRHPLGR